MKKIISLLLALCCTCVSALAAGKVNVAQESFIHLADEYSNRYYCYAKVENTGDKPIKVNAGVLEVYNAEGDAIHSSEWINAHARYLQPGEYTYVRVNEYMDDLTLVPDDHLLTVTGRSDNDYANVRYPVETKLELGVEGDWATYNYMYATVTNNTEETVYNLNLVMALLDAEGNILYLYNNGLYEVGLTPGSSLTFRQNLPSDFMKYFEANSLVPASVDAIAYIEIEQ
ncbi:MAG: hypothetical protein IJX84_10990 [Clostridia bacterium]|nr:hypothetical protein [Clostridia bacterium]